MSKETFVHKGIEYRVVKANPPFGKLKPGMWLRICYGPYEGKEDVLAEVITCDGKDLKVQRHGDSITGVGSYYDFDAYFEVVMKTEEDYLPEEEAKYWAETEPLPVPVSVTDHIPSSTWPEINETSGGERTADLLTATWPSGATGRANPSNIVVCFDGTWNQNEKENTNVHRLIGLLDKRRSISNYYSGVGVGGRTIGNLLDGGSGRGVFRTVRAAYTFVRANFIEGDRIFIFGFSRGAYAARHLAGMIARIGIQHHTEVGYDEYRVELLKVRRPERRGPRHDVHFLGMFDCVPGNQRYWMSRKYVNNPILEPNIRNVAHAVSRDEKRWSFKPLLFERSEQDSFQQVWMPGFHFDVGGDQNEPLNNFALWWMLREACRNGLHLSTRPYFGPVGTGTTF